MTKTGSDIGPNRHVELSPLAGLGLLLYYCSSVLKLQVLAKEASKRLGGGDQNSLVWLSLTGWYIASTSYVMITV
jgi:hypothetical protein